jgi:hypothetical protein
MSRISHAFRSFFAILFSDELPADIAEAYGFTKAKPAPPPAPPKPEIGPKEGALQMLGILQRDARLLDFLMEDIKAYSDDQVGAAVRNMHEQCRQTLDRYVKLSPVIDGVEGAYTKIDKKEAGTVKLLGNVPADGKAAGGVLRHRGWRADSLDLPTPGKTVSILAPAEIEIE